ncbi:MAG: hypothetical protein M5U34_35275 [Chloroflexi bacterium]|nr:hypothetical protein [Chloroflexota bacterium]
METAVLPPICRCFEADLQVGRRGFVVDWKIEKGKWKTAVWLTSWRLASRVWHGLEEQSFGAEQRPQQQVGSSAKSVTVTVKNKKSGKVDDDAARAAANDETFVPAVLKRTGHLSRMDNRVTTQTNGGYVVVQRSTYALAGQTIAVRVSGDLVEPTNNGLYYMYSDHLGSVSAIQKDGSTEVEQA